MNKYSLLVGLVFSILAVSLIGMAPLAYAASLDFISSFTGLGIDSGTVFLEARATAVDSNDRIIVADDTSNLVQIYDSTGKFVTSFDGSDGAGTTFANPRSVAVDSNDRILVVDITLDLVQIYDSTGTFVTSFDGLGGGAGTAFSVPLGIAVNSTDFIFVSDIILDTVQIYTSTGTFVDSFDGSEGSGTAFTSPEGVAFDDNDRIIVTDTGLDIVQIYDSTGVFDFSFVGTSGGGTAFIDSRTVAVDTANRIIVLDNFSNLAQVYSSTGVFVISIDGTNGAGTAFTNPLSVAVDSNDRIIVNDIVLELVQIYSSTGTFDISFTGLGNDTPPLFNTVLGLAVNSTNFIFVSDNTSNLVQIYDSTGAFVDSFDGSEGSGTVFTDPRGVAVDSNDRIIVADVDLDIVQIYTSTGTFVDSFNGLGGGAGTVFTDGRNVAVDTANRIIVLDNGVSKLAQVYTSAGVFVISIDGSNGAGTAFSNPLAIAADSNDRIIVADSTSNLVQIYSSTGTFVTSFNGSDGAGTTFADPRAMAVDSADRIIVADSTSDLVQIYDSTGTFVNRFDGSEGSGTTFTDPRKIAVDSNDRIIVSDFGLDIVQIYEGSSLTQGAIGAIVESLDFDGTLGATPDIIQVSGDTFAIVYVGPSNDGLLKTIRVDSSGDILTNTFIDSATFSTGTVTNPKIVHVTGDKYLIVYGDGNNIHAATFTIPNDGDNIAVQTAGTSKISNDTTPDPDVVKLSGAAGATQFYAIAYHSSTSGLVDTISVTTGGTINNEAGAAVSVQAGANDLEIIKVSGTTYAVVFRDNTNIGHVETLTIPDNGVGAAPNVGDLGANLNGNTAISSSSNLDIVHVTGDVYAVAWSDGTDGKIQTITINTAGTTLAISGGGTGVSFATTNVIDPVLIQTDLGTSPSAFLVAYHDSTNTDGVLKSFTITNAGAISSVLDTLNFNVSNGQEPVVAHRTGQFYVVAYEGTSARGTVSSFNLGDADSVPPVVTSVGLLSNNSNNALAKSGDIVTITVVDNEELNITAVTIGGQAGTIGTDNANTVTATRTLDGTETEGTLDFSITVADPAGNGVTLTAVSGGGTIVTSDFTAPGIDSVAIATDGNAGFAKNLDTVTVTVDGSAGETLTITGTPTIGGQSGTIGTNNANIVTVTRDMNTSEPEAARCDR